MFRYNNPVWIPYADILGQTLPANKGTEMRINKRLLSLLKIIAIVKANLRFQVNFANQVLTIASVEDLTEALYIMQNSTGLQPYKIRFFNEIFYPLYQKKVEEENEQESAIVIQGQLLAAQNKITALYPGTLTDLISSSSLKFQHFLNSLLKLHRLRFLLYPVPFS